MTSPHKYVWLIEPTSWQCACCGSFSGYHLACFFLQCRYTEKSFCEALLNICFCFIGCCCWMTTIKFWRAREPIGNQEGLFLSKRKGLTRRGSKWMHAEYSRQMYFKRVNKQKVHLIRLMTRLNGLLFVSILGNESRVVAEKCRHREKAERKTHHIW